MNTKKISMIGILTIGIALVIFGFLGGFAQAKGAAINVWPGSWQMGPTLDTTILGCPAGNGLARYTGIYYPELDRVYFLGGRCENNTTTSGVVFYFDPDTLTYATTGATMPTPVSNYQVVRVEDDLNGKGPGFYLVGGRKADGTQTTAVQVYYPDDNSVATITTDPFPPTTPYSPGGVAAYDNKIYVFGGFDGTSTNANTYIYDALAAAGTRWTLTACNLPSARSYIGALALDGMIYAIGGDEYVSSLIPLNDTLVLDTADLGSCWQDDLMADLPTANGDAPVVYVEDGYMGGGIYMVGGFWPAPGPYRWVFRYDLAGDVWESFPELAIPDPATGRRNQAAAYIPAAEGRNAGLWTFGGYDGSGANAMTDSSEFYSNILLQPGSWEVLGVPGASAVDPFTQINLAGGSEHTYDLSYTSDVTWNVNLPATVGPIASGDVGTFDLTVDIPSDAACGDIGSFTVTSTAQDEPTLTASATVKVRATCGVIGTVTDFDTGLPIENAYVWFQNTADGLDVYYDGYTDAQGHFQMMDVIPDDYLFAASALHHQPSFYPDGWPDGAISFTLLPTEPSVINVSLVASSINWNPQEITVDVVSGKTVVETLTIQNEGSGPYYYNISLLDNSQPEPPAGALAVPGLPRVDEQIFTDIAASTEGVTDFVVVLDSQADVSFAYGIEDWNARGQAVYDVLSNHAETTQQSLRNFLHRQGVDYLPLYIINAVIVKSANADLVNTLAARQDVSQLVANHQIAIEGQSNGYIESLLRPVTVPAAVEWGVSRINADQVWSEYNARGEGTVVAEIDTGTQWDHPALKSQYRGWNGATANHNYNWYDPYFQCPPGGKVPCDPGDHGTHVMGTMVGYDGGANQIGVAPNAQWISCKGGDEVSGYLLTNELLVCAQWILAPTDLNFQNPDPAMRPDVVNNSWGGGRGDYWFTGTIDAWRAAGIFPAFSNGNAGPGCYTAGSPGDNWHSFASGASDINDLIAGFSSRGPALNTGFLKPQVTSPGVNIRSSIPTNGYGSMSGTSMASPHTAGAVALLYSAAPELVGKVDIAAWILERSAQPLYTTEGCGGDLPDTHPNNTFGYGLLDVYAAVNLAKSEDFTPSWVFAYPYGGVIEPGLTETIDVSFYGVNESGTLTGTLWLVGDDPNHPDVRIPLTMNILGLDKFYLPIIKR